MTKEAKIALVKKHILARDVEEARQHPGLAEVISTLQMLATAFSDVEVEVPLQFCDGDWVATQVIYHQTHTGTFMGIPPTNKRIKTEVLMFHRVVDGKIVQQHSQANSAEMMGELGALRRFDH
ncbi:MAG: ester cyclase [Anaerolineales bacterium]|nr:ester cyclase [Anaerolineales bacterium]